MNDTTTTRPLYEIAYEIDCDWAAQNKDFYAARPYQDAMYELKSIADNFFADSGKEIVLCFLANAATWRGPVARRIKAELKAIAGIK